MTLDVSKLREGDLVTVRGKFVKSIKALATTHEIQFGMTTTLHVCADDIASVEPRPLKVGDRVKHATAGGVGEIIAVHEGYAWVLPEHPTLNVFVTKPLSDLSPA